MDNYYQLLGVTRNATAVEVKAAFQQKMKALEAAHAGGDHDKVQEKMLQQAFLTLLDPARRAGYDKKIDAVGNRIVVAAAEPAEGVSVATIVVVMALVVATAVGGWYASRSSAAKREAARKQDEAVSKAAREGVQIATPKGEVKQGEVKR